MLINCRLPVEDSPPPAVEWLSPDLPQPAMETREMIINVDADSLQDFQFIVSVVSSLFRVRRAW